MADIQASDFDQLSQAMRRGVLRMGWCDRLLDDAVSQAWLTLLKNDAAVLKRFDPSRSTLKAYCVTVAKSEARQLSRGNKRRLVRENRARRSETQAVPVMMLDLDDELTKTERHFVQDSITGTVAHYSPANRHQLAFRIRQKVLAS